MSARSLVAGILENETVNHAASHAGLVDAKLAASRAFESNQAPDSSSCKTINKLSHWSQSGAKRIFDCACVLLALPLLIPILFMIALAVRLTSTGPVLFLQKRMGCRGRAFTIFKFRTLIHTANAGHHAVTTAANQRFTPVGPFLRRWKLDELPQLLNVLRGDMSLVGPRPKIPEHLTSVIPCRPGITGAATLTFGREEVFLAQVPAEQLDTCYHAVVLPAKRSLDAHYMAHATFLSDFRLIVNSVLRRWDDSILSSLPIVAELEAGMQMQRTQAHSPKGNFERAPLPSGRTQPAPAEEATAF